MEAWKRVYSGYSNTAHRPLTERERNRRNVKIGTFLMFILAGLIGGVLFVALGFYTVCTYPDN